MKTLKYLFPLLVLGMTFSACEKDDEQDPLDERDFYLGQWEIVYRGQVTDDNIFGNPDWDQFDYTLTRTLTADVANDRLVLPDFLNESGQSILVTVKSSGRVELPAGIYQITAEGTTYNVEITSVSDFLEEGQMIFDLEYSSLSEGTEIDAEMIMTRL